MSRVFLLSANTVTEPYPVYPIGMAVVASGLMDAGHTVRQFDYLVEEQSDERLKEVIAEFKPDYVGLSLRNIDNVDSLTSETEWYLDTARHLVETIKGQVAAPLVVGGAGFSIMPEDILDYLQADFGIVGEGEQAFSKLIHNLENGQETPAIINGSESPISGDEMYSPCFESGLISYYMDISGVVNLQTKRGCPHKCLYCTYPSLEGNRFRPRNPKAVVEDIKKIKQDHGVSSFFFTDSVFNDAAGHYLELAEAMIHEDIQIKWSGFFRPQGIGPEDLKIMIRSGLYALELGTDASSDATLKGLNKKFTFTDVSQINDLCVKNEIPCAHFIIFGGPGETENTIIEGLDNINSLDKCVVFAFSGIRILPETGMQTHAIQEGVISDKTSLLKPIYYFSPRVDPDKMNNMIEKGFQGRTDRIFPPSEAQARMSVMHLFGYRGLMWDRLISFKSRDRRRKKRKSKTS